MWRCSNCDEQFVENDFSPYCSRGCALEKQAQQGAQQVPLEAWGQLSLAIKWLSGAEHYNPHAQKQLVKHLRAFCDKMIQLRGHAFEEYT